MNDNIQIINKTGEGMYTEGIAYIEVPSTTKKYVFYTLNEKVDNDLTKIYIAETNIDAASVNAIPDNEWEDLRNKMIKISHKETVDDVKFLSMDAVTFNVGDPKKLAITAVAKQAFKDAQLTNTMATNQTETPVTTGSGSFFNQEVVGETTTNAAPVENTQNIFDNPIQPENTTPASSAPVQGVENPVPPVMPTAPLTSEAPVAQPEPAIPNNGIAEPAIETPQIETPVPNMMETPAQQEAITPTISEIQGQTTEANNGGTSPIPVEPTPAIEPAPTAFSVPATSAPVPTAVEQVQEIAPQPAIPATPATPVVEPASDAPIAEEVKPKQDRPIITDEEALKAINTIQEYINQESENNNQ